MEKKEKKTVTATKSEKLAALQIAQAMGHLDSITTANEDSIFSALANRAEKILKWIEEDYFVNKE